MNGGMHRLNVSGIECAPNIIYEHNTAITALQSDTPKFKLPATSYSFIDFLRWKRFFFGTVRCTGLYFIYCFLFSFINGNGIIFFLSKEIVYLKMYYKIILKIVKKLTFSNLLNVLECIKVFKIIFKKIKRTV